jgi:hypothetical protein
MASYIYYTSTTPPNTEEWEIRSDWIDGALNTGNAINVIKEITDGGIVQIASNEMGSNPKKFIVYFEQRQTLDSYLSNNPVNVMTICEDPAVVSYCADNNIVYSISISDTVSTLTEVISSIDPENFDNWWMPYSTI